VTVLPVTISPEAETELTAACKWYENQKTGLGDLLRIDFQTALQTIQHAPHFNPVIQYNARRFFMKRFRYHIYYSAYPDVINILAIVHAHRHPNVWKKALRSRQ
jgi:plasmid stabilization system protein ParE